MQRRTLIRLGLAGTAVLAVAGTGAVLWRPGLRGAQLSPRGRSVMQACARALLAGSLPGQPAAADTAIAACMDRVDAAIGALPPATRSELSQLLALLASPPGRRWFARLEADWPAARTEQVHSALQSMRFDARAIRQQAYHALRELVHAAYFSDPSVWAAIGYPGPAALPAAS